MPHLTQEGKWLWWSKAQSWGTYPSDSHNFVSREPSTPPPETWQAWMATEHGRGHAQQTPGPACSQLSGHPGLPHCQTGPQGAQLTACSALTFSLP